MVSRQLSLKVEPMGFAGGLDVVRERRGESEMSPRILSCATSRVELTFPETVKVLEELFRGRAGMGRVQFGILLSLRFS